MTLIKKRREDHIETHRFTLAGSTRNEKVWQLHKVDHHHFVGYGFTDSDRKFFVGFLETGGRQHRTDTYHLAVLVGNFDTDSSFSWYRRDDTNTECGETQGYVVFEVFDARYLDTGIGNDLVQSNCRADRGFDALNADLEVDQRGDDLVFICVEFLLRYLHLAGVVLVEEFERGKF